ncbi:nickel/cobalt transporter [Methylocapsa sp. S129]|uniref:nickel/cobalt transporter n=1 Tax=Methylocapsa sp. S129 TaxID=1641869 RepID=UPI001FEF8A08|nr:nickel/cobalt transporter [Methylocapsa sp. S129]
MRNLLNLRALCTLAALAILLALVADPALAQSAARPFALPGGEAGGAPTGFAGWILGVAAWLNHLMAGEVKALHSDRSAIWGLIGLSAAYGVFHAAGPGHGKALIASYMFANERALRRGMVLSFLAAILQALVAIALIGIAALIFRATGAQMNSASDVVEIASYLLIAAIGAWLAWTKGRAFAAALRRAIADRAKQPALFANAPWRPALALGVASQFRVETPGANIVAEADCGHYHAPDPAQLGAGFSWRGATATVVAAGARPCSGAIVVLTFALTQGLFPAGIIATFAMALGTAITTSALACLAVFAKDAAMRLASRESARATLIARALELAAALCVLAYGLALLLFGPTGGG